MRRARLAAFRHRRRNQIAGSKRANLLVRINGNGNGNGNGGDIRVLANLKGQSEVAALEDYANDFPLV